MQIVIDVPEKYYKTIMEIPPEQLTGDTVLIRYGTPLPKGHERLIDVGQCDRKLFYQQCGGADSLITVKSAFDMLMSLPTIIEATEVKK